MQSEIQALQEMRRSKVIVYATSDRQNLPLNIEEDVIDVFHSVLEKLGHQNQIDIFIYSRGGATVVPLPLVRLLRKYCSKLGAVVPFRAHSAASMICIGADEIYMTRKAELGPSDPQLTVNSAQGGQRVFASTDLFAYLEFAREKVGWQPSNTDTSLALLEFFHKYCQLPPDLIGKVYRMYTQSKKYIKELAHTHHADHRLDDHAIETLSDMLMAGFGSHDYKIDAQEATMKLGLNVAPFDEGLERATNELFGKVSDQLKLDQPFLPADLTGSAKSRELLGIICSEVKTSRKEADVSVQPVAPGNAGVAVNVRVLPWTR